MIRAKKQNFMQPYLAAEIRTLLASKVAVLMCLAGDHIRIRVHAASMEFLERFSVRST